MVIFALSIKLDSLVREFVDQTNDRLQSQSLLTNPFNGRIYSKNDMIVCEISPIYPNFTYLGWLMAIGIYFIWGFSSWMIPGILIGLCGIFWTKTFFSWIFLKGLHKFGFKGPYRKLSHEELIRSLLWGK